MFWVSVTLVWPTSIYIPNVIQIQDGGSRHLGLYEVEHCASGDPTHHI